MSYFEYSGFCYIPLKNIDFLVYFFFLKQGINLVELKLQQFILFGAVEILVQFFHP